MKIPYEYVPDCAYVFNPTNGKFDAIPLTEGAWAHSYHGYLFVREQRKKIIKNKEKGALMLP